MDHTIFEKYCKTKPTKQSYSYECMRFEAWANTDIDTLDDKALFSKLEEYLIFCRSEGYKYNSIANKLKAIKFYVELKDRVLNWKKLARLLPERQKLGGEEAYKDEDIRLFLANANTRAKAVIMILSSTGCRPGVFETLQIKHLIKMPDNHYAILFYAGSTDEYYGFLTREAASYVEKYLEARGEYSPNEALICNVDDSFKGLTQPATYELMERIEDVTPGLSRQRKPDGSYNIQLLYGFRKWFSTKVKLRSDISFSVGERLQGHKNKLDANYFKPRDELFAEFLKVEPDLTLDKAQGLQAKLAQKEQEEKDKLSVIEARLDKLAGMYQDLLAIHLRIEN